ncbi:hypothetical protein THRCLA_20175 [Thraustotheca clavata]|uniref:CCT domain-containing protein n=1 Tax=Thraustotheca clavata TaxID=74557 RepID=A0A1W0AAN4_9STRA|nr:hypothetical protein THRCLA_20175 [Thraustotheca clavata]
MTMPTMLPPFPHLGSFPVDDLSFSETSSPMEIDDMEAANDIDQFTALLSTVDDEETANDIDAFTDLIESLSKAQTKDELNDVSDLLPVPTFTETDLDALLGTPKISDVDMDSDESDDEGEDISVSPLDAVAAMSSLDFRTYQTPIDPRCCIKTSIFTKIDPRIPMALIPRMDVNFGVVKSAPVASMFTLPKTAPSSPKSTISSLGDIEEEAYVHDPARCWVCKSGKSEERKMVLHRYVEKRHCRNWKRGARYKARSRVASSRVREGGRFVTKCQWFVPSYN